MKNQLVRRLINYKLLVLGLGLALRSHGSMYVSSINKEQIKNDAQSMADIGDLSDVVLNEVGSILPNSWLLNAKIPDLADLTQLVAATVNQEAKVDVVAEDKVNKPRGLQDQSVSNVVKSDPAPDKTQSVPEVSAEVSTGLHPVTIYFLGVATIIGLIAYIVTNYDVVDIIEMLGLDEDVLVGDLTVADVIKFIKNDKSGEDNLQDLAVLIVKTGIVNDDLRGLSSSDLATVIDKIGNNDSFSDIIASTALSDISVSRDDIVNIVTSLGVNSSTADSIAEAIPGDGVKLGAIVEVVNGLGVEDSNDLVSSLSSVDIASLLSVFDVSSPDVPSVSSNGPNTSGDLPITGALLASTLQQVTYSYIDSDSTIEGETDDEGEFTAPSGAWVTFFLGTQDPNDQVGHLVLGEIQMPDVSSESSIFTPYDMKPTGDMGAEGSVDDNYDYMNYAQKIGLVLHAWGVTDPGDGDTYSFSSFAEDNYAVNDIREILFDNTKSIQDVAYHLNKDGGFVQDSNAMLNEGFLRSRGIVADAYLEIVTVEDIAEIIFLEKNVMSLSSLEMQAIIDVRHNPCGGAAILNSNASDETEVLFYMVYFKPPDEMLGGESWSMESYIQAFLESLGQDDGSGIANYLPTLVLQVMDIQSSVGGSNISPKIKWQMDGEEYGNGFAMLMLDKIGHKVQVEVVYQHDMNGDEALDTVTLTDELELDGLLSFAPIKKVNDYIVDVPDFLAAVDIDIESKVNTDMLEQDFDQFIAAGKQGKLDYYVTLTTDPVILSPTVTPQTIKFGWLDTLDGTLPFGYTISEIRLYESIDDVNSDGEEDSNNYHFSNYWSWTTNIISDSQNTWSFQLPLMGEDDDVSDSSSVLDSVDVSSVSDQEDECCDTVELASVVPVETEQSESFSYIDITFQDKYGEDHHMAYDWLNTSNSDALEAYKTTSKMPLLTLGDVVVIAKDPDGNLVSDTTIDEIKINANAYYTNSIVINNGVTSIGNLCVVDGEIRVAKADVSADNEYEYEFSIFGVDGNKFSVAAGASLSLNSSLDPQSSYQFFVTAVLGGTESDYSSDYSSESLSESPIVQSFYLTFDGIDEAPIG